MLLYAWADLLNIWNIHVKLACRCCFCSYPHANWLNDPQAATDHIREMIHYFPAEVFFWGLSDSSLQVLTVVVLLNGFDFPPKTHILGKQVLLTWMVTGLCSVCDRLKTHHSPRVSWDRFHPSDRTGQNSCIETMMGYTNELFTECHLVQVVFHHMAVSPALYNVCEMLQKMFVQTNIYWDFCNILLCNMLIS